MFGSKCNVDRRGLGSPIFGILFTLAFMNAGLIAQSSDATRRKNNEQQAERQRERAEKLASQEKAMRDGFDNREVAANKLMSQKWSIDQYRKSNLRDATDAEMAAIEVDGDLLLDSQKLSLSGISGKNRILFQVQCGDEPTDEQLKARCLRYSMPGNGSSFSFRSNSYRATRYADLTLTLEGFVAGGVRTISFLADLGVQELSSITLESRGVKPLAHYIPPREYQSVKHDWEAFDNGKRVGGIDFSRRAKPQVGHTYALRSIAYRGTSLLKSYETVFNELDYDERTDVVIVFKIVKQDSEGYTILWRQLSNRKAPSYEFPSK